MGELSIKMTYFRYYTDFLLVVRGRGLALIRSLTGREKQRVRFLHGPPGVASLEFYNHRLYRQTANCPVLWQTALWEGQGQVKQILEFKSSAQYYQCTGLGNYDRKSFGMSATNQYINFRYMMIKTYMRYKTMNNLSEINIHVT